MFKHYKMSNSKYFDSSNTTAIARKRKKAFTLVELVIVIAVIGVLATVLISSFATVQNRATQTAALESMKSSYDALYAEDVLDGDVDYGNGVLLFKSTNSNKLFYVIVTEGELGEVGTVIDKNKNESTAADFFAVSTGALSDSTNTADQFDAKVEGGVLKIYLSSNLPNNEGSGDKLVHNQAAHIVLGGTTDIDKNGRGGTLYDMAHNDTSAVKFISTGAGSEKVTTLNIGVVGDGNALADTRAVGSVSIARTQANGNENPTIA